MEGEDPELNLVFYLFHEHHWTPEMYYGMDYGGRDLTWALALHELDLKKTWVKDRRGGDDPCPRKSAS